MLHEFFKLYDENQYDTIQAYFESLTLAKRDEIFEECLKHDDFKQYISPYLGASGSGYQQKYSFADGKNRLGQLVSKIPDNVSDGQEFEAKFIDEQGNKVSCKLRKNSNRLEFCNKSGDFVELTTESENSLIYQYNADCSQQFFEELTKAYNSSSLKRAIASRDVDAILDKYSDKILSLDSYIIRSLNYYYNNTQGNKYGTFLHKAIKKMRPEDFGNILSKLSIRSKNTGSLSNLFEQYLALTNEQGQTILQMAESEPRFAAHTAYINRFVNGNQQVIDIDTHTASVHKTVDISLVRLIKIMANYLALSSVVKKNSPTMVTIRRSSKFNEAINQQILALREFLQNLSNKNDLQLYQYIEPSLLEFERDENSQQIKILVAGVRYQVSTSLRMLDDIEQHNRFGDYFDHPADQLVSCGIKLFEILALTYYSLNDQNNLSVGKIDESSPKYLHHKVTRELTYIRHLYEVRRGYNIDHGGDFPDEHVYQPDNTDENICDGGTVNKLVSSLNSIHQAVEVRIVSSEQLRQRMEAKLHQLIEAKFEPNQKNDFEELLKHLEFWRNRCRISDQFKKLIDDEFSAEVKQYVKDAGFDNDFSDEQIAIYYQQVINNIKISKKLSDLVIRQSVKSKPQQYYVRANQGYLSYLDFIFEQNQVRFVQIISSALTNQEDFKDLINNDFGLIISHLRPQARSKFLKVILAANKLNFDIFAIRDRYNGCLINSVATYGSAQDIRMFLVSSKITSKYPNAKDSYRVNIVMLATINHQPECLREILASDKVAAALVNANNLLKRTALMVAVIDDRQECIKAFLESGKISLDGIYTRDIFNKTALSYAKPHIKILIKRYMNNPILYLIEENAAEDVICRALANFTLTNKQLQKCLIAACGKNYYQVIVSLMDHKPDNLSYLSNDNVQTALRSKLDHVAPERRADIEAKLDESKNISKIRVLFEGDITDNIIDFTSNHKIATAFGVALTLSLAALYEPAAQPLLMATTSIYRIIPVISIYCSGTIKVFGDKVLACALNCGTAVIAVKATETLYNRLWVNRIAQPLDNEGPVR